MRRRRGGGLEDLLQEDIRAKQILLGTLVELSTVALEQVMSTTLGSLKISAHDKVMSGLVMKIAEARLKHLVCVYFFVSALTTTFTRHTHTHTHTHRYMNVSYV